MADGGYQAYRPVNVSNPNMEVSEGLVIGTIFKSIAHLQSFNDKIDMQFRKIMEIVIIYFFEMFFKKIGRDCEFQALNEDKNVVNMVTNKNVLFNNCLRQQNVFDSFEKLMFLSVNKCLGNLELGDKIVSKYSIAFLKVLVEELKKSLATNDFAQIAIPRHLSNELLKINQTNLVDPKFYKLRSDLYEIISICFLEELLEDYIENIHLILGRIIGLDLNQVDESGVRQV